MPSCKDALDHVITLLLNAYNNKNKNKQRNDNDEREKW